MLSNKDEDMTRLKSSLGLYCSHVSKMLPYHFENAGLNLCLLGWSVSQRCCVSYVIGASDWYWHLQLDMESLNFVEVKSAVYSKWHSTRTDCSDLDTNQGLPF